MVSQEGLVINTCLLFRSDLSAIDALSDEVCVYKKDYIESKEWHLVRSVGLDISSTTQLNM